jgi:hypothetical protein
MASGEVKPAKCNSAAMWILPLYVFFNEDFISCFYTSSNIVFTPALFMLYSSYTRVSHPSAKFVAIYSAGKTYTNPYA